MKILLVDISARIGGDQKSFIDLCTSLYISKDIEIAVAVARGPVYDCLSQTGIRLYPLTEEPQPEKRGFFSWFVKLFDSQDYMGHILREFKPDIVHASTFESVKVIPSLSRRKLLFWSVDSLRLSWTETVAVAARCTRIIAGSSALDEFLGNALPPGYCGRVRVIRHALDTHLYKPGNKVHARAAFDLPQGVPLIGMVADLIPWKRHAYFLETAKFMYQQSPDVQFVIVGRPYSTDYTTYEKKFKELLATFVPFENVRWIKDVSQTEHVLPAFDLMIHTAFGESSGRAVCEAMAMEIPVVALDSGAIRDLITHRKDGILVRNDDPKEFAHEALSLLADPAQLAAMKIEARLSMLKAFTKEEIAQRMIAEYKNAIAAETEHIK
jgi:glycosyltransferase involved in cell wall biosynthesis